MKSLFQTPSRSWSEAYKTASFQGIIGYDANPLYLSTMLTDLLCVKEKVVQYQNPAKTAPLFTEWLKAGTWFGFAEVDIKISKHLWIKFEKKNPSSSPNRSQTKLCLNILKTTARHRQNKR